MTNRYRQDVTALMQAVNSGRVGDVRYLGARWFRLDHVAGVVDQRA